MNGQTEKRTPRGFDWFEISRVVEITEPSGYSYITRRGRNERRNPDNMETPPFWSIYGRRDAEGETPAECIGDFRSRATAALMAEGIADGRPVEINDSMLPGFSVTYEIVTPESAEDGEAEETGYTLESGSLREALAEVWETRTSQVDGVECMEPDCSDPARATSFRVCNGMEFETGARESRTLHFPRGVSPGSAARLCRLIYQGV